MALKFIDKQDRKRLNEGRNHGFGGAFCKKKDDVIETVMPLSACGDYYAEIVHSEETGKSWSIHGLSYSKQDIYDKKKDIAYIVCGILPRNHGDKHAEYDEEVKLLNTNYKAIEKFLNWFEKKFKLKTLTTIEPIEDNRYLFTVPLFWCGGTYKISLYKLLSRMALFYTDGDPMEFLNKFEKNSSDRMYWNTTKPKVEKMIGGFIPEQKMTANDSCPHNLGCVQFTFPKSPAELEKNGISMQKMSF